MLRLFMTACLTLGLLFGAVSGAWALRIGVVAPDSQDMFWLTYLSFIERGAEQLDVILEERDAHGERLGLLGHAQGLIDMGVDGLIFSPCCGVGQEVVRSANAAGVPVIATVEPLTDVAPGDPPLYLAWIGGDDQNAASRMVFTLLRAASTAPDGSVHLLALEPRADTPGREARLLGLEQATKDNPKVTLVGRFSTEALPDRFASLLEKWPHLGAIWAGDAGSAMLAQDLLREHGLVPGTDVMVSAMDLAPENVYSLRTGGLAVDVGGQWMAGGWALLLLHDFLHTGEIAAGQSEPFGLLTVTGKTISNYENNYPQGLPSYDFLDNSRRHREGQPVVHDLVRDY